MDPNLDNIDKINLRLAKYSEYLSLLRNYKNITLEEFKANSEKSAACERLLQLAVEVCIDVAELFILDQRLKKSMDGTQAIITIGEAGIIDKEFAKEFSSVVRFINALVHDYLDFDDSETVEKLNHLEDFERFAKEVAQYLT